MPFTPGHLEYFHEYQCPKRSLTWPRNFLKVDSSESAGCLQCQSRRGGQRAGFCQRSCFSRRHTSLSSLRFSPRWEWHLNSCCINNVWEKRRRRRFRQSRHLTLTHLVGLCPFNSTGLLEPSGVQRRDDRKLLLTLMWPYPLEKKTKASKLIMADKLDVFF